jgi:alpha-galactosidase
MLVLGRVGGGWYQPMRETGLTPDEQRTHLGLWVMLAAPLLLGCDLTTLDAETLAMLRNEEVLTVHQDPLGLQARRVLVRGPVEIWRKDLADGSTVIGVFDRGDATTVGFEWQELGLEPALVRDLWAGSDVDTPVGWEARLPSHGSVLMRVWPIAAAGRPAAPTVRGSGL